MKIEKHLLISNRVNYFLAFHMPAIRISYFQKYPTQWIKYYMNKIFIKSCIIFYIFVIYSICLFLRLSQLESTLFKLLKTKLWSIAQIVIVRCFDHTFRNIFCFGGAHCVLLNCEVCLACHLSNIFLFLLKMASRGVAKLSSNKNVSNRPRPNCQVFNVLNNIHFM